MAGRISAGSIVNPKLREAKAYCEGRAAAYAGLTLGDNPHADTTSDDHAAWDAGFASHQGGAAEAPDSCADLPTAAP